ncbi:Glycosyltransferase [Treponema sp. JC4]|uniref:glycosyltransferase family 4 protein n=1 Tax=Treponema sp. JC4 TaxID=1124982 RepID=UPI00025B0CB2|nr:glycosyltransferase family 4 protein [Treponema sp. JC4]EID84148.1 Glycosyltransferase [Treponema sp. JC4]
MSKPVVNIDDYDLIHFHDTYSIYTLRKSLENYKGKIALTSHSPQPLHQEFIENSTKIERKLLRKTYSELYKIDEYAFNRADYIVFPTKYSDEPYINRWEGYREFKKTNQFKYRYFLTGTLKPQIRKSKLEIREKYNIPEDAFVLSFVGRHSAIKGYDDLIKYCEKFCSGNTYVLVAGAQGNIVYPKNDHWVEIGWTNDPYSIMNAADVFVLPNKETYFDLVLLEVLSIGTIALVSNTGGNKYFDSDKYPGVVLYDNEQDF